MSFLPSAVAGPSRLPYVARPAVAAARRYASSSSSSAPAEGGEREQAEGFVARQEVKPQDWLVGAGWKYKTARAGQRALWLGGSYPFPNNPTFRPPPPVSDDLQNMIVADLRAGKRTTGQIAQAYNVSKARIEAIRKLKEVEAEFRRQDLPLQTAFQANMEALLGVKSPLDKSKKTNIEARRAEESERAAHPSTSAERDEEYMHEHGASIGGAFGDMKAQAASHGITRDAWEFKDETTVLADRVAEAKEAAEQAKLDQAEIAGTAPKKAAAAKEEPRSHVARTSKSVYRFVDTSSSSKKQ